MNLKEKKIIVTGADGFIGSHLVEQLVKEGCKVKAFVYYNSFNNWGWLDSIDKNVLKNVEIFSGDIRDPNGVNTAMKGMDVVFHLAALIGIPFSYHSPNSYIDTNVTGTLNVLQAAMNNNLERVLVTSTSEVYGTARFVPITEDHPRQPQSPYSASKIGADCIAESFFKSFNLPITIVRPFNTYGPRQSARAIIPSIIIQILNGAKQVQLGDLSPTRDLVYVKDTVMGFIKICECDNLIGQDCNIAMQAEFSIQEIADKIMELLNKKVQIISDTKRIRPEKSEVYRLYGSNKKITNMTNWIPGFNIMSGLQETINWFQDVENLKSYKSDIYNI